MAFSLIGEHEGRRLRLTLSRDQMVLGKDAAADLVVTDPTVSRRHCRLQIQDEGVLIEDLDSSNGVRINGARVREPSLARPGDRLRFGEFETTLVKVSDADARVALTAQGDRPNAPSQASTAGAATTLAPMALDRFSLEHLPVLLRASRQNPRPERWCQQVASAIFETLPLQQLSVVSLDSDAVIARYGGNAAARGETLSQECGHYRVTFCFREGELAVRYQPLSNLFGELLALVEDPAGAIDSSGPIELDLPDPPSQDSVVRRIYRRARQVADSDIAVLILGESGTGKELLAQYLHRHGGRDGPFVAVNCAAIPGDLLEAELLGIDRGVATGVEARPGRFEQAHHGTLFLDEIGDMPAATQAAILRVLQEGEVTRVGGSQARPARPRIIAATNRRIEEMIESGAFRLDLLHRIADWEVTLPPLRDRGVDLAALALHFLSEACESRQQACAGISEGALAALHAYTWPGNVRELQREMKRIAVFLGPGELVTSDDLRGVIRGAADPDAGVDLAAQLAAAERRIIRRALAQCASLSQAAESLGIARSTLYRRMEQLGIGGSD